MDCRPNLVRLILALDRGANWIMARTRVLVAYTKVLDEWIDLASQLSLWFVVIALAIWAAIVLALDHNIGLKGLIAIWLSLWGLILLLAVWLNIWANLLSWAKRPAKIARDLGA